MGKDKMKRFEEMCAFSNVFQNFNYKQPKLIGKDGIVVSSKGRWKKNIFQNDNDLVVELACGGGEYTIGLGNYFPQKNIVGIDIKGARIYKGARLALEQELHNVRFLRTRIELLTHFFDAGEIDEAWITFPDPFPKDKHEKHRLTSSPFFSIYRKVIQKGGLIHLKTDSTSLFEYTIERLEEEHIKPNTIVYDVYNTVKEDDILTGIQTHYEKQHIRNNKQIHYLNFNLT